MSGDGVAVSKFLTVQWLLRCVQYLKTHYYTVYGWHRWSRIRWLCTHMGSQRSVSKWHQPLCIVFLWAIDSFTTWSFTCTHVLKWKMNVTRMDVCVTELQRTYYRPRPSTIPRGGPSRCVCYELWRHRNHPILVHLGTLLRGHCKLGAQPPRLILYCRWCGRRPLHGRTQVVLYKIKRGRWSGPWQLN